MNSPVNMYAAIVYDLPNKLKDYIDELDKSGQIDHDEHHQPYLIKVDKQGPNYQCFVIHNGAIHNFILNTRKRKPPVTTWGDDGYKRPEVAQQQIIKPQAVGPRGERAKRTVETWSRIVEQILR